METVLNESKLDVIDLNETRLESRVPDWVINIENYQIYRKDRNTAGSGVAVYVREILPHFQRLDIIDLDLELIGIEITPKILRASSFLAGIRPRRITKIVSHLLIRRGFCASLILKISKLFLLGTRIVISSRTVIGIQRG